MFRGAFTAIRDAARKLFKAPAPVKSDPKSETVFRKATEAKKAERDRRSARQKRRDEAKAAKTWARKQAEAWKGRVIVYSDRSYYADADGRFIRLQPGQTPEERLNELAGRPVYAEPQANA